MDPAIARSILDFHRFCVTDPTREQYRKAIAETVSAGDVVIDLGAGTGMLAILACQAGARHVYAVELEESVRIARVLAAANGWQDQITFVEDSSYNVTVPEKADVLVTDTFDSLGVDGGMVGAVIDARERLLRAGATIVPNSLESFLAPVECPNIFERLIGIWSPDLHGIDFSVVKGLAANNLYGVQVEPQALISEPQRITTIELADVDSTAVQAKLAFTTTRSGTIHGLIGWFQSRLARSYVVSNAPGGVGTRYCQSYLPLETPRAVEAGSQVAVEVYSRTGRDWLWQVWFEDGGTSGSSLEERYDYIDQSTVFGFPFSLEDVMSDRGVNREHKS